jgi:beta-lactamase superfamily II metal-dependent hydrolase
MAAVRKATSKTRRTAAGKAKPSRAKAGPFKAAKKIAKKTSARKMSGASGKKAAKKTAGKTVATGNGNPAPGAASPPVVSTGQMKGLRIRMYRVGFGDFFLLSVPTAAGARHILIDCGVHAQDLGSIREAVAQMAVDCGAKLALVIMTHRHADHISGFGTCAEVFRTITVDRVWMPWFEDPANDTAKAFQTSLTALAARVSLRLAARGDAGSQLAAMVDNITGGMTVSGVSNNQKALEVLNKGFMNQPEHDYYRADDAAKLPRDLEDAGLSAQILGPPSDLSLISKMTDKNNQFLTGTAETDDDSASSFPKAFRVVEADYPADAFSIFSKDQIKAMIEGAQPDVMAAQATAADNTLNNQSLVILFSFAGKNLLFAGDAQWGNWENFLYGGAFGTPGHTEMTERAKAILGKIDFYKVGHHGSTNATPKDAVAAMRLGCVGMCSTQIHAYNEVPREPLLKALSQRMQGQLARSDQVAVDDVPPNKDAGPLPDKFREPTGKLFIDYNF